APLYIPGVLRVFDKSAQRAVGVSAGRGGGCEFGENFENFSLDWGRGDGCREIRHGGTKWKKSRRRQEVAGIFSRCEEFDGLWQRKGKSHPAASTKPITKQKAAGLSRAALDFLVANSSTPAIFTEVPDRPLFDLLDK
ncbi:MAG: hypothetical protein ACHRHE_15080, partial [Tepidisphaerales bacterium]